MTGEARLQRRARRQMRLYPPGWRQRFGEEFEQLLIDEMRERPHAPARTADVAAHALLARLSAAGLSGRELEPEVQAWRSLRVLGGLAAAFLGCAIGIWAQLSVGWSWASPKAPDTRLALTVMSGAVLGLCVIFLLAVGVMLRSIGPSVREAPVRQLVSLAVVAVCIVGLWIGCAHVANGWPGASARSHHHSAVPVQLARPAWAATLWLSAYWTHPDAVVARPGGHFAWMIVSAVLLAAAVIAGSLVVRRATPSRRSLRTLTALAVTGVGLATVFVAGAATWIVGSGPGPHEIFQPGAVDEVGLVLLGAALAAAAHATRRSLVVARRSPTA